MPTYKINDKWILNKISSESSSFSNWVSNLVGYIEKEISQEHPEAIEEFRQDMDIASIKNLDREISSAKKELDNLGFFGDSIKKISSSFINTIKTSVENELKKSFSGEDDLDLDLGFLTGERKNLSSALFDVTKERGIDSQGLLYLIKSLPDLETFLYYTSVKKYYRDHTEHALRVAVLGDFLMEKEIEQGTIKGIISDFSGIEKDELRDKFWWIAGLLHDIGYPLGKLSQAVNYSILNQILKCYPTLDLKFTPFEIGLSWKSNQEDYINILSEGLSKKAKNLIRKGAGIELNRFPIPKVHESLKNGQGHSEYNYASPLELDHGVISALCLLNSLGTPEELIKNDNYIDYVKVAKAMALHNFKEKLDEYNFENHPLTFFLMLMDELQEWGRPIPIQVRDTYFTTDLKKITLLDEIEFQLDEFKWVMEFSNQKAKELMNFQFKKFSKSKFEAFSRLHHGKNFKTTQIQLKDIEMKEKKNEKKILNEQKIFI